MTGPDLPFRIRGVSPATGRVVELVIMAASPADAKTKAEEAGIKLVVATPANGHALAPPGDATPG